MRRKKVPAASITAASDASQHEHQRNPTGLKRFQGEKLQVVSSRKEILGCSLAEKKIVKFGLGALTPSGQGANNHRG